MSGEVNVQIIVEDGEGFRDAIYVSMSEFRKMSESQIETLRQERIDNHRQYLVDAQKAADEAPPLPILSSAEQATQILRDALAAVEALPADPVSQSED